MLLRFDPFRELDRLADQAAGATSSAGRSVMAMDAVRDGDEVTVHFDLPGVDRDTIDITVEKNQLVVRAERRWRGSDEAEALATERRHGTFTRSLFLGESLDTERIDADYADGVLSLTIPVAEVAKPRKITVGTGQAALAS